MKAIYARSLDYLIGSEGKLPWNLPSDLEHFKHETMGRTLVMGRVTWESLPAKKLPGRECLVFTRTPFLGPKCIMSVDDAPDDAIVIGGAQTLTAFWPRITSVVMTEVDMHYGRCALDTRFHEPPLRADSLRATDWYHENGLRYRIIRGAPDHERWELFRAGWDACFDCMTNGDTIPEHEQMVRAFNLHLKVKS